LAGSSFGIFNTKKKGTGAVLPSILIGFMEIDPLQHFFFGHSVMSYAAVCPAIWHPWMATRIQAAIHLGKNGCGSEHGWSFCRGGRYPHHHDVLIIESLNIG
jgi:hypothetical protein